MNRYYLTELIFDGAYKSAIRQILPIRVTRIADLRIRRDQQAGVMLVKINISDADHQTVITDPRVTYLPLEDGIGNVLPLTATLAEIGNLAALKATLELHHIPMNGLTALNTIRELLNTILKRSQIRGWIKSDDWIENMDTALSTIGIDRQARIRTALELYGVDFTSVTQDMTIRQVINGIIKQSIVWPSI